MTESFPHFVFQHYGFAIMAGLFFLYFLISNKSFSPSILRYFYIFLTLVALLTVSDICHSYYAGLEYPTWQRMFFASCSYSLRVFVIFSVILLFDRNKPARYKIIAAIPAVINVYASFSAFFTTKAFYYTADNILVRGPIISVPFIVSIFYFALLIFESAQKTKKGDNQEVILVNIFFVVATIATIMEAKFSYYGALPSLAVSGIMVYYMYFLSDNYYYDPLTNAGVRARLYENVRGRQQAFGVIMFDLNDLKKMNDTEGHNSGDRALQTVARVTMDAIPSDARLYRIGGDEFVIICSANNEKEVEAVAQNTREAVEATPYSVAIGYTLRVANEPIERALARADEAMYKNKADMKKLRKEKNNE